MRPGHPDRAPRLATWFGARTDNAYGWELVSLDRQPPLLDGLHGRPTSRPSSAGRHPLALL